MSLWGLMLMMFASWLWGRRRREHATTGGPQWVLRDAHGCYLTVFDDHEGHHFIWTSERDKATHTANTQILDQYNILLIKEQPENGPFRFEQLKDGEV